MTGFDRRAWAFPGASTFLKSVSRTMPKAADPPICLDHEGAPRDGDLSDMEEHDPAWGYRAGSSVEGRTQANPAPRAAGGLLAAGQGTKSAAWAPVTANLKQNPRDLETER